MPRRAVELHDSEVLSIAREGSDVVLRLSLYLHEYAGEPGVDAGTGWSQDAVLVLKDGAVHSAPEGGELWITHGTVRCGATRFENLLPLPFVFAGAAEISCTGGEGTLHATGSGLSLELVGEPQFVETFDPRDR